MASFSGRGMETERSAACAPFARSTVVLPQRHGVVRVAYRPRSVSCHALALDRYMDIPVVRVVLKLLRLDQGKSISEPVTLAEGLDESAARVQRRKSLSLVFRDATIKAVHVGLTLTGVALQLASRVVSDLQQRMQQAAERKQAEKEEAAVRQEVQGVQTQLQYEMKRQQLERQGKDDAFVKMLHILDRCHLDHDVKWALVQKHTADKAEFSERLSQLYNLAQASKDAVDTLLRPDASRKEINTFWKSPETVAIIAEEDKLKSLVFAQMLQASSP